MWYLSQSKTVWSAVPCSPSPMHGIYSTWPKASQLASQSCSTMMPIRFIVCGINSASTSARWPSYAVCGSPDPGSWLTPNGVRAKFSTLCIRQHTTLLWPARSWNFICPDVPSVRLIKMSSIVSKNIELDAVGSKFEAYLTAGCIWMRLAPLWCDLGCCSRTVAIIKAVVKPRLLKTS